MSDHPSHPNANQNVAETNSFLTDLPEDSIFTPDLEVVCQIHLLLFRGISGHPHIDAIAGALKTIRTFIQLEGGSHATRRYLHHVLPEDVPREFGLFQQEMRGLRQTLCPPTAGSLSLQAKLDRLIYVATFHARFVYIHPFADGNGRVGRAIAVFQLMQLFEQEIQSFLVPNYVTGNLSLWEPEFLRPQPETHRASYYETALAKVRENLVYLVRYFNLYCPDLVLPRVLQLPPVGPVEDIRHTPP